MNEEQTKKASKILLLFLIVGFGLFFFLAATFYHSHSDRKLPNFQAKRVESAMRGSVFSSDGFVLASSKKVYKAVVNTYNINPNKKEVFVNLFSIYAKMPKYEVEKKLQKKGNVTLSYNIDSKTASYLKQLNVKLNQLSVFQAHEDKNGRVFKYGLSVVESGEGRDYLYKDSMEPILGYIHKDNHFEITRVSGVKGVEKSFDHELEPKNDTLMVGQRDIAFNVILNKDATFESRKDGLDVILGVPLKLQKKLERLADKYGKNLGAKEVVIGIMESKSGKLIGLASNKRFNPNAIKRGDYPQLNSTAIEYSYEPGSIIKPIIYGILLEKKLTNPNERIDLENGRYKLYNFTITDTHKMESASMEEVLLYSSNIGMAKMAQRLSPAEYNAGLQAFSFGNLTGIDLPYEAMGVIPSYNRFRSDVYRATVSYGYGLRTTFMQMLKAYNIIVNNGVAHNPFLVEYLQDSKKRYRIKHTEPYRVLSKESAEVIKETLIKIVKEGTAKKAQVKGVTIGGKTGTAHIAQGGRYINKYNSSFFGFAKDHKKREYTIGITVFRPNESDVYFSSQTAVPLFKEVVELLIKERYLNALAVE